MQIFEDVSKIRAFLKKNTLINKKIGFVPTMGALHAGHLTLIERSVTENDLTICSIYVNPLQFNNVEDLKKYPRTLESDKEKLEKYQNVHLFIPQDTIMYHENPKIHLNFGSLEATMEGTFRPGHFNGVGIVVAKLFNIIQPNRTYFGQKDLQQCLIIRQLIRDLSFDIEMIIHPTVREADGLALSSRNQRLTASQRKEAVAIPQALELSKQLLPSYGNQPELIKKEVEKFLAHKPVRLEYFHIVNTQDLKDVHNIREYEEIALCIAAYVGEVRLLDNIIIQTGDLTENPNDF
ncbi:MAG: pantoate--beta-alanine ligase [Microscillaceae bacterium]|nr:pantoate--beta-alanine ligase [Microscillaceae bacterium]